MIIYTRLLFWAAGFTVFPNLMLINPKYRQNHGLIEHERVHQRQMRADGWLRFVLRYAFSRRWRTLYEVEAYKISIAFGMQKSTAASHLVKMYFLNITYDQALELLS